MRFSAYEWKEADMAGGSPAIDFVNTVSSWSSDPVDRLDGAQEFARWAAVAGLIEQPALIRIEKGIARDPDGAAAFYGRASELRSALWGIFSAVVAKDKAAQADLAILGDWTCRAARCSELFQDGARFLRRWDETLPEIERPALLIARAAEELLEYGPLDRLHACGGDNCEWLFLDTSKNGRRRWCSMATCGNEAKVRKFRARQKKATA